MVMLCKIPLNLLIAEIRFVFLENQKDSLQATLPFRREHGSLRDGIITPVILREQIGGRSA